jgi:hypothetical protein
MVSGISGYSSSERRLWLIATAGSLLLNALVMLSMIRLDQTDRVSELAGGSKAQERRIQIQPVRPEAGAGEKAREPDRFARTSDDQVSAPPENPDFVGERDTQATSERTPTENGPDLPSQEGVEPRVEGEAETTESRYQDGVLAHEQPGGRPTRPAEPPAPRPEPAAPAEPTPEVPPTEPGETMPEGGAAPAERERLAQGTSSVEVPAPPDAEEVSELPAEEESPPQEVAVAEPPRPEPVTPPEPPAAPGATPGFRGFQRKTELRGSISRQGRSALNVKSGALGTYHAALSRAIEQAWQRQVIRNRDFITPGVLRIRVVLDEDGQVRSVGTVEEVGVGTIQKGFTHMAIREADLPKMPTEVKRQLDGEPLELLYNFIF